MASHRYALSSLNPELNSDRFIGFYFAPTDEDRIKIVKKKNAGANLHPMFKVDDDLFGRLPEPLEECNCFTKLEPVAKNRVNRKLRDESGRYWKHLNTEKVVANNQVIGWVTILRLHWDKKRPTEWHMRAYSETKGADDGRYVLCWIYKTGKNKDSGSSSFLDPNIENPTVLPTVASFVGAGQISSPTSQANGAGGEMNQVQQPGQYSYTPDFIMNAATYTYLPEEHDWADMVSNSQQLPSSSNSIDGFDTNSYQYSNWW